MAFQLIKRSQLPVAMKGVPATDPKITISDKGQLTLNPVAVKWLGGNLTAFGFDIPDKGKDKGVGKFLLFKPEAPIVVQQGITKDEMLVWKKPGPSRATGKTPKGNILFFSFGTALNKGFGADNSYKYNYTESGSQTFPLTLDDKNQVMHFVLPNGSLAKRPTTPRKPRKKKEETPATTVAATAGKPTNGSPAPEPAPATTGGEPDLVLEL